MPPKTGSFAKRLYLPRALGSGVGFFAVAVALSPLSTPFWVWTLLIFQGFIWPHAAFLIARRAAVPYLVERRNLLIESAFGGLWVAAMHFNALPTVLLLSMLCMNCIAVGGPALLRLSLGALSISLLAFTALLKPDFLPDTSPSQVYACLPMLALYPLAVGGAAHRLASKLAEHKRAFQADSRLDSLTGLLNQGAWRTELDKEFQIGTRGKSVATLALIDIDHFKAINDGHGHLIGDKVLKVVGRIGGDEFAVILRETDTRQAQVVLARVQKQLRQKLRTRSDLPTVSLSIGLAPFTAALTNVEDWIHASDTALYAAKRQGRDQIVSDLG